MDDRIKGLVQELGDAINETVTKSERIESIMQTIRDSGYEIYLMLEANIAMENTRRLEGPEDSTAEQGEKFTDDDLRFLKRLRIQF